MHSVAVMAVIIYADNLCCGDKVKYVCYFLLIAVPIGIAEIIFINAVSN